MVHLNSHLGAVLALLCCFVAFVAGNPVRLPEDKRATSSFLNPGGPFHSYSGTRTEERNSLWTKTGSASHISYVAHGSTRTEKHHHKLTKTGTDEHTRSHHEHTRTEFHKSHETDHRTSTGHETSVHETKHESTLSLKTLSMETPGHYTVEKRQVSVFTLAVSTAEASHEIPHPSHGPHTETHSTHHSHTRHSTHKEHSHVSATVHPTSNKQTHVPTTDAVHTSEAATVPVSLPWWGTHTLPETLTLGVSPSLTTITVSSHSHPPSHGPETLEAREHSETLWWTNPGSLPNATTIVLPTTTYCVTSLYLPHSPQFRPGTKTVWTSTATLYPEWDCHGCASLTVLDPWTMGQPTTHYHHTKTSKSIISVVSPVCKSTSGAVTLTAS